MELTFEENEFVQEFRDSLLRGVALSIPYGDRRQEAQLQADSVPAAVLALFGFSIHDRKPFILFTQRTHTVDHHKGQISFPGGRAERINGTLERPSETAVRETTEEVGIPPELVELMGELPVLGTVTKFRISPLLGLLKVPLESSVLVCQETETLEAFWVPVSYLLEEGIYRDETFEVGGIHYPIQVFMARDINGTERRIWGATASILKNILDRLQALR